MPFPKTGKFESIRQVYFQPRDESRKKELLELERDVDYLLAELRRLERRCGYYNLISSGLTRVAMQLTYMNDRNRYTSDREAIKAVADEFCYSFIKTQNIIFDYEVLDSVIFTQTEGGHEVDVYIPADAIGVIPTEPKISDRYLRSMTKDGLIKMIVGLCDLLKRGGAKK